MKLFGKRSNQKEVNNTSASQKSVTDTGNIVKPEANPTVSTENPQGSSEKPSVAKTAKPKTKKRLIILLIIVLLLTGAGAAYVFFTKSYQSKATKINQELALVAEYQQKNDIPRALEHAKKLVSYEPDNFEYITLVASLIELQNPNEAKPYYAKLLDDIKKVDNPDEDGKLISTYWAAAGLAEKAGQTESAKRYYQKVIDVADTQDGYEQSLVTQSQEALKRLK